jgi:serine/threonine-protein kinase
VLLEKGAILGGKYRLEESIGKGGMGEVFEAIDLGAGRRVALKVVNRTFATGALNERLRREAEAARRVRSRFVPQLYDVDETPDGELFLVMERLHGETLSARMRRNGVLAWEEVARVGGDVLRGLVDAHAAGVIHRDLKPGNIFLEGSPFVSARILDFGVCKLEVHEGEPLTVTGESVGTIAYMAPEQIRGAARVDPRADLYAFAMVVFEALCGRLAYDAQGSIALIACKLEKPARSVRDLGRMPTPPGLEALLARCLSRDLADRPASAADLLGEWLALGDPTVPPLATASQGERPTDALTEAGVTAAPTQSTSRAKRRTRLGLAVAAAALVASSGVLIAGVRWRAASSSAGLSRGDSVGPEAAAPSAAASVGASERRTPEGSGLEHTASGEPPGASAQSSEPAAAAALVMSYLPVSPAPPPSRAHPGHNGPERKRASPRQKASPEPQLVTEPRY